PRILRGGFAALPHQRVEHGHLLRAGEALGPPGPEPPRWPRLADRLLPNLREHAERPEHPAAARAAGRPGLEHDDRVPAGLLQFHVLPGVHRLSGVRITVPHGLGPPPCASRTAPLGRYSAIVRFGNVTRSASVGAVTRPTLLGAKTLASVRMPLTLDQAMRVPAEANG